MLLKQVCQWAEGLCALEVTITVIKADAAQPHFAEQCTIRKDMMPFVEPPFSAERATGYMIEIFLDLPIDHGFLNAG